MCRVEFFNNLFFYILTCLARVYMLIRIFFNDVDIFVLREQSFDYGH
jgi:hypothetical protein